MGRVEGSPHEEKDPEPALFDHSPPTALATSQLVQAMAGFGGGAAGGLSSAPL